MNSPRCRFCDTELVETFVDLGMSPISNAYLTADRLGALEHFYPLHAYVCGNCFLVQLQEFESPDEIFGDYAYFSSYSESWLEHCRNYANMVTRRFNLTDNSNIIELASNDGYLLQYFRDKGLGVLGIEPAGNVAKVAIKNGIETEIAFFGTQTAANLAAKERKADLLIGNNVLAHVPDLNDFVAGMKIILKPDGIITMEFPHLLRLMERNQFDTIYHEHFSYFSFLTVERVFAKHGLRMFDVKELSTHGGSIRIYACHDSSDRAVEPRVDSMKKLERDSALDRIETYRNFGQKVQNVKRDLLEFLIDVKREGKTIVGYGAPAKGNTLLNYCGIRTDFLDYTVDLSPHKQGRFLPGTHIPIYEPDRIAAHKPDYVLILPWNLKDEIMEQMADVRSWGGKFVVPIPQLEVIA